MAAAVLNHPANGVAWLANKLASRRHPEAGLVIMAGSFTAVWVRRRRHVPCRLRSARAPSRAGSPDRRDRAASATAELVRRAADRHVGGAPAAPTAPRYVPGSGLDWLLIDTEHSPNDVRSLLAQLQAMAAYPVLLVVRPPSADRVVIKQLLDIGVQTLLVPMVETAEQAEALVRAVRYPPHGIRGVGSALARALQWNRVPQYLQRADEGVTLLVQVESRLGLDTSNQSGVRRDRRECLWGPRDWPHPSGTWVARTIPKWSPPWREPSPP